MTPNLQRLLDAATMPISVKERLIPDGIGEHDDMAELLDMKGQPVGIQMWNPKEKDLAVLRLITLAVNHFEDLMAFVNRVNDDPSALNMHRYAAGKLIAELEAAVKEAP